VFLDQALPLERWSALRRELTAPRQVEGLTLGVWGLGRVGARVARAGAALNMRVIYHDLRDVRPEDRAGAAPVDADTLLASSDVLSIHVDGREENRGLLGGRGMGLLRPDVVLINSSRGFVVHAGALAEFLRAHPSATALLDVHEPEPFPRDYPLLGVPNAHLLPHIGAATAAAHLRMSLVVEDVWRVLSGQEPRHGA
jgi:D-3-phosphoglycerate dehydrogenase